MQRSNQCTDKLLISLYRSGNNKAFEVLFDRHKDKVYTTIHWYVKDKLMANKIFEQTYRTVIDILKKDHYNTEQSFLKLLLLLNEISVINVHSCSINFKHW